MTLETDPEMPPEINREVEQIHEHVVNSMGYDPDDVLVRAFGRSGRVQMNVTFERGIGEM